MHNYTGYTDNFASNLITHSGAGDLNGKMSLDLRSHEMKYSADISAKNADMDRLFRDTSFHSDLNGTFKISGTGTNPKTMAANFLVDGNGTTGFKNYNIEKF